MLPLWSSGSQKPSTLVRGSFLLSTDYRLPVSILGMTISLSPLPENRHASDIKCLKGSRRRHILCHLGLDSDCPMIEAPVLFPVAGLLCAERKYFPSNKTNPSKSDAIRHEPTANSQRHVAPMLLPNIPSAGQAKVARLDLPPGFFNPDLTHRLCGIWGGFVSLPFSRPLPLLSPCPSQAKIQPPPGTDHSKTGGR